MIPGRLEARIHQLDEILLLAQHCRLDSLLQQLDDRMKKAASYGKPVYYANY